MVTVPPRLEPPARRRTGMFSPAREPSRARLRRGHGQAPRPAAAPRPRLRGPIRLALVVLNLAALALVAWSVAGERPAPAAAPIPAYAGPVRLAPGQAWTAVEEGGRQEERLAALGLEIGELIEAVMGLRRDTDLLAEDGQLAHERLGVLEERLGRPVAARGGGLSPRPGAGP